MKNPNEFEPHVYQGATLDTNFYLKDRLELIPIEDPDHDILDFKVDMLDLELSIRTLIW